MDLENLERFRNALQLNRDTLLRWMESDSREKSIQLGGSKSDEVMQLVTELKDALESIQKGQFGKCEVCHEDVEPEQLEYDFTSCVCLTHYSDEQLRTLERELELASKVHKDLLPCCVPELTGIEMAAHTETARIAGGDYYDFFECHNNQQGLAIADVMDKGLPASMLMSNLQASLRILGPEQNSLDSLAVRLNKLFRHNLHLIKFISLFMGTIDLEARTLNYCNAGHHPPLWWRGSSNSFAWLNPTGPALGLTVEPSYHSESVKFGSGDIFLFYTDGLLEAGVQNGGEFGETRVLDYLKTHGQDSAKALLRGLLESARDHAGRFHDDVTLLVIKVK